LNPVSRAAFAFVSTTTKLTWNRPSAPQSMLVSRGCRLQNAALYKGKQQLEFFLHIPAELDMRKLELDLRAVLPNANSAKIAMDIV